MIPYNRNPPWGSKNQNTNGYDQRMENGCSIFAKKEKEYASANHNKPTRLWMAQYREA